MGLISNPVYWQNLPPNDLKFEEIDKIIRPILDTLYIYQKNIRANSPIIKVNKKDITVANIEIPQISEYEKLDQEPLKAEIKKLFFRKKFHELNSKNFEIDEQIGLKDQVLISPVLSRESRETITYDSQEFDVIIKPIDGIYIEFDFQSDDQKYSVKNALRHHGKLILIEERRPEEKKNQSTYVEIIQSYLDEDAAIIKPLTLPNVFEIRVMPNTSVIEKKIRAIQSFIERPKPYYFPILRLFEKFNPRSVDQEQLIIQETIPKHEFKYLNSDRYPGVEEQRNFVNIALNTPDFAILEGPPGSGKTTTILEILHQATKRNLRVLMVASTNVAVDNVLERIDEEREKGEEMQIFPIRIGDVDEGVRGEAVNYLLENICKKESSRIITALEKKGKNKLTSIQKKLIQNLQTGDKQVFEDFILDIANVVCSTTIKILRYPAFQMADFSISQPFDILIIDEASKTTLQEFLVPALLAKKWIIIGDKMQLSPFIELGEIKALADRCFLERDFEPRHQWLCCEYFSARDSNIVVTDIREMEREFQNQFKEIKHEELVLINPFTQNIVKSKKEKEIREIEYKFDINLFKQQLILALGSNGGIMDYRCFTHEIAFELIESLPDDFELLISPRIDENLSTEEKNKIQFTKLEYLCRKQSRKYNYFHSHSRFYKRKFTESDVRSWIDEVSWRLKRIYELRHQANNDENNTQYQQIQTELESLLPKWTIHSCSEIDEADDKGIHHICNALRIKANNAIDDFIWEKNREFKKIFDEKLVPISDPTQFMNYFYVFYAPNSPEDQKYWMNILIWFVINQKDTKSWLKVFITKFPQFFNDLLTYQIGNHVFDTLRIEFPSIIELLQEGLMVEPKYRNTVLYNCTVYKGYQAKRNFWKSREVCLTYQHRMHSDISSFIRNNFYEGKQVLDPDGRNGTYSIDEEREFPFRPGPHNVWDNVKGQEEFPGRSYKNEAELDSLYEWYCGFEKWASKNPKPKKKAKDDGIWEVAIITFYQGQETILSNCFKKHFQPKLGRYQWKDEQKNIKVKICNVDSFQGQEADVVLLSFVRTKKIGFLDSRNRLNVALSRARYYQVLFGNVNFFKSPQVKNRAPILYELAEKIPHRTSIR